MGRSSGSGELGASLIGILVVVVLMLVCAGTMGVTDEDKSKRVLESNGYSDVEFTGYDWFACGEGDWYRTGFIATSPADKRVSGAVCCGLFLKSCTIRFE